MLTRVPDYFEKFTCLAGACPDTCCGQWEIVIDAPTKARYISLEGELGNRLRQALTEVDGEARLALTQGRCPMLAEDGLCDLISQHGEGYLSTTCRCHPRFTEIYGGLQETMLTLSCPAAARLLLRQEPLTFQTTRDDTPPKPNDLDGDLFHQVLTARETAYAIVQNRTLPIADRLALLLCFTERVDGCLETSGVFARLCDLYRNPNYQIRELTRIRRLRKFGTMTRIRQLLLCMEHLTEVFPAHVTELEMVALEPNAVYLEQLTMYFLFRWWLKAACNGYLWRQGAAVVVSVLSIASLSRTVGSLEEAARLYSKEIENSEENLTLLRKAMDLPYFSKRELLKILDCENMAPHFLREKTLQRREVMVGKL